MSTPPKVHESLCRCPENVCLLHPTLRTCSMRPDPFFGNYVTEHVSRDEPWPPRVIEGEVVGEPLTITGGTPSKPELQNIPFVEPEPLPPISQKLLDVDFADIEQRLLNTYAGGFVGAAFEDAENIPSAVPEPSSITRAMLYKVYKDHVCICGKPSEEGTIWTNPACPIHGGPQTFVEIILTDKDDLK